MGVFSRELLEVANSLTRRASAPEQVGGDFFLYRQSQSYSISSFVCGCRLVSLQVIIQQRTIQMILCGYGLFKLVSISTVYIYFSYWLNPFAIVIIIGMTQILALILGKIRQPRVIAEVIVGVILGPSIMGRIPNFTNTIFPTDSIPMLNLTATIGLVLFLFIVGVEIDVSIIKKNAKASMIISVAGLVIPLGLGAALAVPIYHQFIDPSVNYGYFILFVSVAVGITAFPVLCRILTELKLLDTTVGVVTLSAGVGNDVGRFYSLSGHHDVDSIFRLLAGSFLLSQSHL